MKVVIMKARMKNQGSKMFWVIFPKRCLKSVLLIWYIAWLLPKIFYSGFPDFPRTVTSKKTCNFQTNIAELVEYALLPHNDSVSKPRALNTFLGGITEIRVDNGLIKNKKVLSDLIEKKRLPKFACKESVNRNLNKGRTMRAAGNRTSIITLRYVSVILSHG